jgi:hypothetical protein
LLIGQREKRKGSLKQWAYALLKDEERSMNNQQDDRQAIDWISESRKSCHPVKKPYRGFSDLCGDETIKRYWLTACATWSPIDARSGHAESLG